MIELSTDGDRFIDTQPFKKEMIETTSWIFKATFANYSDMIMFPTAFFLK